MGVLCWNRLDINVEAKLSSNTSTESIDKSWLLDVSILDLIRDKEKIFEIKWKTTSFSSWMIMWLALTFCLPYQCGKQSKSERFRPIVFDKIINKLRNPLFIARTAKKGPRKEISRKCLLICVAKTNLNCIKPKTRLLLIYATCQIYASDMLQIACLEMY